MPANLGLAKAGGKPGFRAGHSRKRYIRNGDRSLKGPHVREAIRVELDVLIRKRDDSQWRIRMLAHMAYTFLITDDTGVPIAGPSGPA